MSAASLLIAVATLVQLASARQVQLPLGIVEGTTTGSFWSNRTIYQYQGIPFAEPPVGSLRFKRPVKYAREWTGVQQCTDFGPICPQNTAGPLKAITQDENCLTLNVYTNKENTGDNTGYPVMVYIHGGSFRVGAAVDIQPDYLLDKDVVLVVPQYRLGPLGFLSLKTPDIPGNQGFHDIALALEWVQENIEYFGGDPTKVTIFGQSAGAAAVTLMLFSPLVQDGWFHRVIAQSGSALGTWVMDDQPVLHATMIATHANCTQTITAELTACLMNAKAQDLLDAHTNFLIDDIIGGGRAVGGNHAVFAENGDQSFFPEDPAAMFKRGNYKKRPMMAGTTKHEGTWFLGNMYDLILIPNNFINESDAAIEYMSRDMVRQTLEYGGIEDRTGYAESFMQAQYFTPDQIGNFTAMTNGLVDIIGVGLLKASTFTMVNTMSRFNASYMYSFNFLGRHTTFPDPENNHYPFTGGVAHSDELFYLFPKGKVLNAAEEAIAKKMVELWTNYATSGVPSAAGVPTWPVMSTPEGPYLRIDNTPTVLDSYVREEYTIAVKEGLGEKSSVTMAHVSLLLSFTSLLVNICFSQ